MFWHTRLCSISPSFLQNRLSSSKFCCCTSERSAFCVLYLQGNLLDDTDLINVLAVTKRTAAEVSEKLTGASETDRQIRNACEEFRPVAHRATLLFFLISDFSVANCMYQTSLPQVVLWEYFRYCSSSMYCRPASRSLYTSSSACLWHTTEDLPEVWLFRSDLTSPPSVVFSF